MRFLIDENISPETEWLLKSWKHDVSSIAGKNIRGMDDLEVIANCKKRKKGNTNSGFGFWKIILLHDES